MLLLCLEAFNLFFFVFSVECELLTTYKPLSGLALPMSPGPCLCLPPRPLLQHS